MGYFYYRDGEQLRQVIADRYNRQRSDAQQEYQLDWNTAIGPITATYDRSIQSVSSLGGTWKPNPNQDPLPCPTNVSFSENTIDHPFDSAYHDNSGVCSYRVVLVPVTSCETFFYSGDQIVLNLKSCPEILEDIRSEDCSECCNSLLAEVRGISI